MADTVWSHIVTLFDGFFRYSVFFLVSTASTSIMPFFLQFPSKPPSATHGTINSAMVTLWRVPYAQSGHVRGVCWVKI